MTPKAPEWLRLAFRDGVDERRIIYAGPPYSTAKPYCWLAQHDKHRRPCSGKLERAHVIPRQRVENALAALMPYNPVQVDDPQSIFEPRLDKQELILLAAWDSRNGIIACEHHHRRFDSHATPELRVHRGSLPGDALEFALDWGLEYQLFDLPRFYGPADVGLLRTPTEQEISE